MKICIYCRNTAPDTKEFEGFNLIIIREYYKLGIPNKVKTVPLHKFRIKGNTTINNELTVNEIIGHLSLVGQLEFDPFLIKTIRYQITSKLIVLLQAINTFTEIKNTYPHSSLCLYTDNEVEQLAFDYIDTNSFVPGGKMGGKKIKIKALLFKLFLKKLFLTFIVPSKPGGKPFVLFNFGERYDNFIRKIIGESKIKIVDDIIQFSFSKKNASILHFVSFSYLFGLLLKRNRMYLKITQGSQYSESFLNLLEYIINNEDIIFHIYLQLLRINGIKCIEDKARNIAILINNCRPEYTLYLKKNRIISYCLVGVGEVVYLTDSNIRVDKLFVHSKLEKDLLVSEGVSEKKIVDIGLMIEKKEKIDTIPERITIFSISAPIGPDPWGGFNEEDIPMLQKNIEMLVINNPQFHFVIKSHPDITGTEPFESLEGKHPNVEIIRNTDIHELIQSSFITITLLHSTTCLYSALAKKISICLLSSKSYHKDPYQLERYKALLVLTNVNKLQTCFSKVVENRRLRDFLNKNIEKFCSNYKKFDRDRFFKEIY